MKKRILTGLAITSWVLAPMANAFQQKTVNNDPEGATLWWGTDVSLTMVGNITGSDTLSFQSVVKDSYTAWVDAMGDHGPRFHMNPHMDSDQPPPAYNPDNIGPNMTIVFPTVEQWKFPDDALAVTLTTFNTETGENLFSTIEWNPNQAFNILADGETNEELLKTNDIANTLVHEFGHALGLGHSDSLTSTMYAYASPGEISKRLLGPDDYDGIGAIYGAANTMVVVLEEIQVVAQVLLAVRLPGMRIKQAG
jgi:predicted Zn-dependent protease